MKVLDFATQLIPGYERLPPKTRIEFERTASGQSLLHQSELLFQQHTRYYLWFIPYTTDLLTLEQEHTFDAPRETLLRQIENNPEYKDIIRNIHRLVLAENFRDFELLSTDEQNTLLDTEYTARYCNSTLLIGQQLAAAEKTYESNLEDNRFESLYASYTAELIDCAPFLENINTIKTSMQTSYDTWFDQFRNDSTLGLFQNTIEPRLQTEIEQATVEVQRMLSNNPPNPGRTERNKRAEIEALNTQVAAILDQVCPAYIADTIHLQEFNRKQSNQIAQNVLDELTKKQLSAIINEQALLYQAALLAQIEAQLKAINDKKTLNKNTSIAQQTLEGLSNLFHKGFAENNTLEQARQFVNAVANAHAFLRATNCVSQNDFMLSSFIDVYNSGRWRNSISETTGILSSILKPFAPLFAEYRDISQHESNPVAVVLRSIIPMLVITAVVIIVFALLTELIIPVIPDITALIILIPTLYIGLALATQYVVLKDSAYHTARHLYYGQYDIPEFQINQRMIMGFNNDSSKALEIRNYYVSEIKRCDEIEAQFVKLASLDTSQMQARKENLTRRCSLQLEWYDIHSNSERIGHDKIKAIARTRLETDRKDNFDKQIQLFNDEDKTLLERSITGVTNDFRNGLQTLSTPPDARPAIIISANAQSLFFTPKSLEYQTRAERADTLIDRISPA